MLNYIWGGIIMVSIIVSAAKGTLPALNDAIINGTSEAINMTFSLMGMMCLWTGLMKIASESGLTVFFSKLLRPVTKLLFPTLDKDSPALEAIVMNMTANILGMSNAATPLGLNAVSYLAKEEGKNCASDNMCMFIILNTASIQLIPTTILAMRQWAGSQNPYEIIVPVWIASISALTVGVSAAKFFAGRDKT